MSEPTDLPPVANPTPPTQEEIAVRLLTCMAAIEGSLQRAEYLEAQTLKAVQEEAAAALAQRAERERKQREHFRFNAASSALNGLLAAGRGQEVVHAAVQYGDALLAELAVTSPTPAPQPTPDDHPGGPLSRAERVLLSNMKREVHRARIGLEALAHVIGAVPGAQKIEAARGEALKAIGRMLEAFKRRKEGASHRAPSSPEPPPSASGEKEK